MELDIVNLTLSKGGLSLITTSPMYWVDPSDVRDILKSNRVYIGPSTGLSVVLVSKHRTPETTS